jgi:cytochrome c oxidase cbb3-type subunit 3
MRVLPVLTVLLAAAALAGCGSSGNSDTAQQPTPPPAAPPLPGGPPAPGATATDVAAGKAIFQANCVACHGANGKGIDKEAPDFTNAKWQAKHSDQELLETIANGHKNEMPAFKNKLTEQQRKDALAYVRTFPTQQP